MSDPLKVAIAGLGTVGVGTIEVLTRNADLIAARCGRQIVVTAISALNKDKDRGIDLSSYRWFDDPIVMAVEADADVIVELIGGSSGTALDLARAAFKAGRHVVTANKALVAEVGTELAISAEKAGKTLAYEAAVAGGIPIIKALREGLAGNDIKRVIGILNGTCNYILSTMEDSGRDFADVLKDAQDLGYAEADPSFDIDGVDAAHKLAILASLSFGTKVSFKDVYVEGIRTISAIDFTYARDLGYRIKLLGLAGRTEDGVYQRVHPCLIDEEGPLASVDGSFNAVIAEGDFVGRSVYEGRGAGAGPTASAVVADIIDIAAKRFTPPLGVPAEKLTALKPVTIDQRHGAFYLRLKVVDRTGVFADIGATFRDHNISMESILQRDHDDDGNAYVVIITHAVKELDLRAALATLDANAAMVESPQVIRIENVWGE
ncbi:MAG: homoserine dehydrogenase [Rhodospirillaceae bacterium]